VPLGRRLEAHVEVFGADRVVLVPAGIGARPPLRLSDSRIVRAACFGAVVTLDPTGTVYFESGASVGELFRHWGQQLSSTRIASFTGGRVRVYVNGRLRSGSPGAVRLAQHAEIVLEIGPRVPPHSRYAFAAPPAAAER
jgi:hypothetical protein